MRKFLAVLAGAIVAVLTITLIEFVGHRAYPPPAGLDMSTPDAVAAYVASAPLPALLLVAFGWFAGALAGGWTAIRIGGWPPAAWIIAGLIAIGGIFNATQIPAPLWMQIATVLAPALGGWAAVHFARR